MRRIQNRRGEQGSEYAAVGDGEGAATHFFYSERPVPRLGTVLGNRGFDVGKGHLRHVTQNGNHQAPGRAHRHADVLVVVVDGVVALDVGVDRGKALQGLHRGFGEKGHETQAHAVGFFELILVAFAQRHHRLHVHLVEGGQYRGRLLGLDQALGDAHA